MKFAYASKPQEHGATDEDSLKCSLQRGSGTVIRDENGKPIRMLGVHTDVTAFKVTAVRLQEVKAKRSKAWSQSKQAESELAHTELIERARAYK